MAEFGCIFNSTWCFLVGYVEAMKRGKRGSAPGRMAVPLTEDGCMCEEVRVASRSTRCEESVRHPIEC